MKINNFLKFNDMARFAELVELHDSLEPWEEEVCRKRLHLMIAVTDLFSNAGPDDKKEAANLLKPLYELVRQPVEDETHSVPFEDRHWGWLIEMSLRAQIFENDEELKKAMDETAEFYKDGKSFNLARWTAMATDITEAQRLAAARRLN